MSLLQFAHRIWQRHRWSVPLSLVSATFFLRLAWEVHENELDVFDAGMQTLVDGWRGSCDELMIFLTTAGGALPMTLVVCAVLFLLVAAGRSRESRFLLWSSVGCVALNVLLKLLFHRARPHAEPAYLLPRPHSLSFPSGHTMGSAGVLGSLAVIARVLRPRRPIWVAAILFSALGVLGVALSRVYLGAHYPSDVLGGLFAAASWISAVTGWIYPRLLPHERSTHATQGRV
ncbi:MAG TPA: phosphatase PAP2 family protein [Polyangiaceae bacterium]|nr:phosphatase PAP2 family protein [Polyangiaceae bacterium]